jgi:histidine triad (HIT) family protein
MTNRAAHHGGRLGEGTAYAEPMTDDCLFCAMVAGDITPDVVHETPTTLAIRDIDPQAPTHVLVVPKSHHRDVGALAAADPELLAELFRSVTAVARQEGLGDRFRLVFNTGAEAGQSVFHVHAHVLGGRPFGWPPG